MLEIDAPGRTRSESHERTVGVAVASISKTSDTGTCLSVRSCHSSRWGELKLRRGDADGTARWDGTCGDVVWRQTRGWGSEFVWLSGKINVSVSVSVLRQRRCESICYLGDQAAVS